MTFLAASIGADYALMSQDTAVAFANDAQVSAMAESLRKPSFGASSGPAPIIRGHVDKCYIFPKAKMAIGSVGVVPATINFARAAGKLSGIDEVALRGAGIWEGLPESTRALPLIVTVIGWSEERGEVRRLMMESAEGMKRKNLVHPHVSHPPVFDDDPAAAEIKSLYRRPLSLNEARRLHWLLGRSAARASLQGSYGEVGVIGGRLQSILITATEAKIQDAGSLDADSDDDMPELVEFRQTYWRANKQYLWDLPVAALRQRWANGRGEAA